MEIKKVGYFKELKHGNREGESLYDAISSDPQEHESDIIKYLESGLVLVACGGVVDDILDSSQKAIASPSAITDGIWVWPDDLVYYVQRYHAKLNREFVSHMEKSGWIVNQDLIDIDNLIPE